jgi:PAS domain S-box-containing protein
VQQFMSVLNQRHDSEDKAQSSSSSEQEVARNRFFALAQESADVFWMLTPEGEMREVSANWQTFTGQKTSDCSGTGWRDAMHPADQPEVDEALVQAVTARHTSEATCQIRRSNGMYRSLHLRIIPVRALDESVGELIICGKDITKRNLALRVSKAQVQLAMKTSQVGMWDWDVVADQMTWTDQCKALFGWSVNTPVTYKSFLAALHLADRERVDRLNRRVLAEKGELATEYRVIWPDGSVHWVADRARGIFNARGKALHMVGATIDITALKQAEEQAREADRRTRDILESITDAFACIDTEERFIYVNQRMEKYAGESKESMLGKCIWDVLPDLRGTALERACRAAMETQKMKHIEMHLPNASFQWADIRIYPTRHGLSIYAQDTTERKHMEDALRENEKRFRHFVDANIIGITTSSMDGMIYEANDAFLTLSGYSREDLAAGTLNWSKMTAPEWKEREMQARAEVKATGTFQPFEKEYITKDGRRVPVLVGGTLFHWGDCPGSQATEPLQIGFVLDMSVHKEMERQKDLFLGMASHELKTPLAALKGTLQLVERRLKRLRATTDGLPPDLEAFVVDLAKHLTTSVRQVDLQAHLINGLMDVSRITANTVELSLQPHDLTKIVSETVEDLRVTAPDRSIVLILPENTTVPVLVDAERISQVITNYITNAIRYSRAGQAVRVGLGIVDNVARVWVKDQGPGLSKEACREIWQCFHKVKGIVAQCGSGKGLGLGLYICRTLIAQHQGEVGVESTPGQGCTFWFTLPLAKTRS